ncbi:MAG: ATP-binding protein, partial [Acidimicrobiia bacterium]|nr:ATP-binding protein [Acidimicrobiia bacterium]
DQARRQLELVDELAAAAGPAHTRLLHQLAHQVRSGRRQAESLLVLAGAAEPATRTAPVAVERVVAAALSEIDGPQRIVAGNMAPAAVAGSIAADLAHLLSELVANGLQAAGPDGPVAVGGEWQPGAFVLTVADTGPDLDPRQLAAVNDLVSPGGRPGTSATPLVEILTATGEPPAERTPLGLAVVRHLAGQHGLLVRFRARAAGGLQAEIALPRGLALPPPAPTTLTRRPSDRSLAQHRSGVRDRHR